MSRFLNERSDSIQCKIACSGDNAKSESRYPAHISMHQGVTILKNICTLTSLVTNFREICELSQLIWFARLPHVFFYLRISQYRYVFSGKK